MPVSDSQGPARTDWTLWRCFAHTPVGAALAAQVICSQMSGPDWRVATREQVMPGQGRDRFAAQRAYVQDAAERTTPAAASWAGYRNLSYRGSHAEVGLLIRTSQGYAVTSVRLDWADHDWKVVPTYDGDLHTKVTGGATTDGYILWEA